MILIFLLVWYYCTLTIRESILKVNGSRIKGWWRLHHFISTVVAGILLIWPQNQPWEEFRHTFMWFIAYISELILRSTTKTHLRHPQPQTSPSHMTMSLFPYLNNNKKSYVTLRWRWHDCFASKIGISNLIIGNIGEIVH